MKEMLVHLKGFAEISTTISDCILLFAAQFVGVIHNEGKDQSVCIELATLGIRRSKLEVGREVYLD